MSVLISLVLISQGGLAGHDCCPDHFSDDFFAGWKNHLPTAGEKEPLMRIRWRLRPVRKAARAGTAKNIVSTVAKCFFGKNVITLRQCDE
jgi:hypothetical protein